MKQKYEKKIRDKDEEINSLKNNVQKNDINIEKFITYSHITQGNFTALKFLCALLFILVPSPTPSNH